MAVPSSYKSLRVSWSQSITSRGIWRETGPVRAAKGRQQIAINVLNRSLSGFSAAKKHPAKLAGALSSVSTRKGSGSTENGRPSAGESAASGGGVPSKESKTRKEAVKKHKAPSTQQLEEQDHDTEIQRQIEVMGSKLKGATMSIMREAVGKGKYEFTPIAILPHQEECPPVTFHVGTKTAIDYETLSKCKRRPGLGQKTVYTNENLVAEESDYMNRSYPTELPPADSISPQVSDMAAFLVEEVGMGKTEVAWFVNSPPSLLGVSVGELRVAKNALEALGLHRKEVASLLTLFPCSVGMDWANVGGMYRLLCKEVGMSKPLVVGLAKKHPIIFTLDCGKVRVWPVWVCHAPVSPLHSSPLSSPRFVNV